MSNLTYKERIQKLQTLTDEGERKIKSKEQVISTSVMIGAAIPLLVLLILYFGQPKFVTKKEGDKQIRDGKKIFYFTVGITILIWVVMYAWNYYNSKDKL